MTPFKLFLLSLVGMVAMKGLVHVLLDTRTLLRISRDDAPVWVSLLGLLLVINFTTLVTSGIWAIVTW